MRDAWDGLEAGRVVVALGSNLGERMEHLAWAAAGLRSLMDVERISRVLETPPEDGDPRQGPYLNAVAVGTTSLRPDELLEGLLALERERGRVRRAGRGGAARTLDLDLIFHGVHLLDGPGLRLPHPRWHLRPFVALPLLEVLPDARDPETGLPLIDRVPAQVLGASVRWLGPLLPPLGLGAGGR